MKKNIKIVLLLSIFLLLSACTNNANFSFEENQIISTVESEFSSNDYIDYSLPDEGIVTIENGKFTTSEEEINVDSEIKNFREEMLLQAFDNNNKESYKENFFKKEGDKYYSSYSYTYNYDNFINNYLFSHCFESFDYSEDDEYYNIKLSGKYNCEYPLNINVTSKNGIENSNSIDIKKDTHSWYVYDENNIIEFSIRKKPLEISKTNSNIRLIAFIIIVIMIGITFITLLIIKKQSTESD